MRKQEAIHRLDAIGHSLDAYYFNHNSDDEENVPLEVQLASAKTMLRAIRSLCIVK